MKALKLRPVGKDYLWGGTRLREEYGKDIPLTPLAETWECSVHPDGESVVVNGEFAGMTLREVLMLHPEYMGSKYPSGSEFPIIVKFIDAKCDLSVQVHPNDAYARKYENQNGKTEMWYVLDADEDASLIYGFEHPVTEQILRNAVQDGTLGKHLHKVKVQKGDVYYVPAGTVHGIGAGTMVAEIQESSNVTYRVYDYDRVDKDGNKRELHFDKACEVMDMNMVSHKRNSRIVRCNPGYSSEELCCCKYFRVTKISIVRRFCLNLLKESFQVLLCIDGTGMLHSDSGSVPVQKGECVFVPAEDRVDRQFFIDGRLSILLICC